jgi:hypothetical protein
MSKLGIIFCQIYAFIIALCLVIALAKEGDPKGKGVLLSVPIALQQAGLQELNINLLHGKSYDRFYWLKAYALFGLPTFVLLYFVGKLMDDEDPV